MDTERIEIELTHQEKTSLEKIAREKNTTLNDLVKEYVLEKILKEADNKDESLTDKMYGFLKLSLDDREFAKKVIESDGLFYGEDL